MKTKLMFALLLFFAFNSLNAQTTPTQITLNQGQSYNFSTGEFTNFTGGDFYLTNLEFWANNGGQRGTIDLGDLGSIALDAVEIPAEGYSRRGVAAVVGHIYVSLAQEGEEGSFIIFRVDEINDTSVTLTFIYVTNHYIGGTQLDFVFEFSETVVSGDPRQRAVAFHSITFLDSLSNPITELVFGTSEANDLQYSDGWYENELSAEYGAFQWAGGSDKRAKMDLILPSGTKAIFMKILGAKDDIQMVVQQAGEIIATLRVDNYWHNGFVAVSAPSPEPAPIAEPEWLTGRYFPHFPATDKVYVIPAPSALQNWHGAPTGENWRINQSYETMMALTLVGMQGVINRNGPKVYLDWDGSSRYWIPELQKQVEMVETELDGLSAVNFLFHKYANHFSGAVIYDPDVPETINLATTIAGLEDRIMLAPEQSDMTDMPQFQSVTDLRELVQQQGWDTSIESQTAIYQWIYDNLWPQLEQRMIGVISAGPPASRGFQENNYWPLGLAARDYMVALKMPVLYLSPSEEPQRSLFAQFLEDAPSPIPVLGFFSGDEPGTVGLASEYGDWVPVLTITNQPIAAGSMTVFSGVRPEIQRYTPELNPSRIISTLGEKPVVMMWASDGDNLEYQSHLGFSFFGWSIVQNQRFAWTTNPTLIDLAPSIWNHYIETAAEVEFIAGLSGAGYAYPQLMNQEQLQDFLDYTNNYMQESGLRSVRVDSRGGEYPDGFLTEYYDRLNSADYLGAIYGWSGSSRGIGVEFIDNPAPIVRPSYTLRLSQIDAIADDILSRMPGQEFIDINYQSNPACILVNDPDAYAGQAILIPQSFINHESCCLAVTSSQLSLIPGEYIAKFRLKAVDNQSNDPVARIYAGVNAGDWFEIATQTLAPSDFQQAGQYKDFELQFQLDTLTTLEFRIDYAGGTDIYADYFLSERQGDNNLPVFAPVWIGLITDERDGLHQAPTLMKNRIENGGGVVLTPDEFLAALNPQYMIDFAKPTLGAGNAGIIQAEQELAAGNYIGSLLTVREALRPQIVQELRVEPNQILMRAGEIDSVQVFIESVTEMSRFVFNLLYDPEIVKIDTIFLGDFPRSTGRSVREVIDIENPNGEALFGGVLEGSGDQPTGSGVLATVILSTQSEGASMLALDDSQVGGGAGGETLGLGSLIGGQVTVQSADEAFEHQVSETINHLYCVSAISDLVAWASGANGTVLRTTDGGNTWTNVWNGAPGMNIYTIDGFDENNAVLFGIEQGRNEAVMFFTTDGGVNWPQSYSQPDGWISGIKIFNQNQALAIDNPANGLWSILASTNGGGFWELTNNRPSALLDEIGSLNGMSWVDNNTGWFGSNGSRAFSTSDGGSTWHPINIPLLNKIESIAFNDEGFGLAASNYALVRSTDNGANWDESTLPEEGRVRHVTAHENVFWLLIDNTIYKTEDKGLTWGAKSSGTSDLRFIDMVSIQGYITGWAVGNDGQILKYEGTVTGVKDKNEAAIPTEFTLWQNYPNPFNPSTTIQFALPKSENVVIQVYNILGQKVATLLDQPMTAGVHKIAFNSLDLASGVYVFRLKAGTYIEARKMLFLK